MPHHSTKVTRTTSMMEPSPIEWTNMTYCPKHVHQSQHHGSMGQLNHGKVIGNVKGGTLLRLTGPMRVPRLAVATSIQKGSFTRDIGTQLTLLVNITHHLHPKQVVSFFCICEFYFFQLEQSWWMIFRCSGKRKPKASLLRSNDFK